MTVRLNWINRVTADSIKVYRDTSPFDFTSKPSALATLAATASEYIDSTASSGATLYYAIAAVSGASEVMSALVSVITASTDSRLLLEGDMQSGADVLLLEGDMQSGSDGLLLEGDMG